MDYGSATLRCKIWSLPFLGLRPTSSTLEQSKEREGSNFAIWQPWQQASSPELTPPEAGGPGGMDREALEMINEYFYGVRVFPGQDPNVVYVGWVTTQYHIHSMDFTQDMVRVVTIQQLDNYGRIAQRYDKYCN